MTRRQRVAVPVASGPVADSPPPPRIDPATVLGDMAALGLTPPPDGPRLTSLHPLPEGARLLDYEIVGLIGEGGFGIVYLAYDATLERHVAIKEYLPATLAARASSQAVMVKSQRHADAFGTGLRSFINEARLLARFDHPSLVKVLRFWEGNGTAYMVMPFYEGPTLAHALETLGRPPTEEELLGWLRPLLHALSTLHAVHCYHRDIAPDNILLTPAGPLLLDFGAARRVVGQAVASPTVVIKPGYAPIEQYGEALALKQGPWTDLYALAGVVYAAITGAPPTSAVERWIDDRHHPLSRGTHDGYSAHFLEAIDAALALRPGDRPSSAAAFWKRLNGPNATHASWSEVAPQHAFVTLAGRDADTEPDAATEPATDPATEMDLSVEVGPDTAPMALEPPPAAVLEAPLPVAESEPDAMPFHTLSDGDSPAPVAAIAIPSSRRRWWLTVLAAALLIAAGVWAFDAWRTPSVPAALPASLPPPREAPPVAAAAAAPTPKPAPAKPSTAAASAPAKAPVRPAASAAAPRPATAPAPAPAPAPEPEPARAPAPAPPPVSRPAAAPAPAAVAGPREPVPVRPVREPAKPQAAHTAESNRRCAELLQRASLETLRPAELSFLTRECRP